MKITSTKIISGVRLETWYNAEARQWCAQYVNQHGVQLQPSWWDRTRDLLLINRPALTREYLSLNTLAIVQPKGN